ncbi:MAG TPA: DegT/DnrJ/EryC1/StrS family aminotransferase [Phycisphaerales bacterium]|nr:DegT/DnrJ/EryC1/StrS family aminotransferase [Phycisphaerales bacterium]HIN83265.1 DegT/DnrJ/EryC1/StrS family aminotransferase [Phycisphaerales bacterium]HIO52774.1 DegT/DnrJ/EryC1/StrS family aminotransferase [Phycisphaerales bacterium]
MSLSTPPSWPIYAEDEREAVERVLCSGKSNYWTGEEGKSFEQEFAQWCGISHGLCVFNGTVALELALRACGIGTGDEVIVTPRSFLASAAAVVAVGATPVFADVDSTSGNITAETISCVITEHTRGIVVVHIGGWPAEMPSIMKLASKYEIKVIEDCAQAHGAEIDGQRVGTFGHVSAFSFCQDKIISTGGEGGMILTNDQSVYDRVWSFRDHGRDRESTLLTDHPPGFRWLQHQFGTNARMTEMQAAIGRCQLLKVGDWVEQRNKNARAFSEKMQSIDGVEILRVPSNLKHSYYRVEVAVSDEKLRDSLLLGLNRIGIAATIGPCPEIYKEPAFQRFGLSPQIPLPMAEQLGRRTISLPTFPGMESIIDAFLPCNCLDNP